ncbi:MAG: glycerate kinase [Peptococcaceae bacterium]|jgi:glycerate kinase|nr:glycerate kinase [Peptococcaceae bacterium]MDH7524901.1 glycerate kinase [Peptococcaceae bacterium]
MKRVIIAPDSFKESMTAVQAANKIKEGFTRVFPELETVLVPMSDGGEGFTETMAAATGGRIHKCMATGPLGAPVEACYGLLGDGKTAVLEMATAAGLALVPPEKRNPLFTTTYGVGELILHAVDAGAAVVIVGIGGSSTNDGGAGMAQALGAKLLTEDGREIERGAAGLQKLHRIDTGDFRIDLNKVKVLIAADVDNPLCGPRGASYVYAKQKGATPDMIPVLDQALFHYAGIVERDLGVDIKEIPGAGAAGGLGGGMAAFLDAEIKSGVEIALEMVKMEELLKKDVDLVITGEGQINRQTVYGKVPVGVARLAKKYQVPVIALVGSVGEGAEEVLNNGIDAYFSIVPRPLTLKEALEEGGAFLADQAEQVARVLRLKGM